MLSLCICVQTCSQSSARGSKSVKSKQLQYFTKMDIRGIGGERDKENLLGEEGDTEVHTGSDNGSGSDFRIKCSGGEQTQYIKRYGEKMQNGEVQRTKTGVAFVCVLMLL